MVYRLFDKKSKDSGIKSMSNQQLAGDLYKPIIRNFKRRTFNNNFWRADLADMKLMSKYNKGIRFLWCLIDRFNKYAWFAPLKDKKGTNIVNGFQNILYNSIRKSNKIWVDQGNEFYNNLF